MNTIQKNLYDTIKIILGPRLALRALGDDAGRVVGEVARRAGEGSLSKTQAKSIIKSIASGLRPKINDAFGATQ